MTAANPDALAAVLFDLGGVIVELGDLDALLGSQSVWTPDRFWPEWLGAPVVAEYERGQCDDETFCAGVVDHFGLDLTAEAFAERFARWPQGLNAGITGLLERLNPDLVTATASNTNALHWESAFVDFGINGLFDRHYPSFRLGLVKPTADYFNAILGDLGLEPSVVAFIDDNQINVDGARAAGLVAERAKGTEELAAVLKQWGLLDAGGRPQP